MGPESASDAAGSTSRQPYAGQRAVLATMHGKGTAIAPAFRDVLRMRLDTAVDLDTDALGTFTGEIPRAGNILDTAIAKARLGMAAAGLPIGIASEGSYGPHPLVPFMAGGVELMVLVDDRRGIVVSEHLIEDAPVFGHALAACPAELEDFLKRHRFPSHALIVRPNLGATPTARIHKGVRDRRVLADAVADAATASLDGKALVEADMRAHMNPTRMASIARLARILAARMATRCPACGSPGFGRVDVEAGLPCEACEAPTARVHHEVLGCAACAHRAQRARSDGRTHAEAGECDLCNP